VSKIVFFATSILAIAACNAQVTSTNANRSEAADKVAAETSFATKIRPLLVNYCANCHAPGDMEGLEFLDAMTEADVVKHRGLFASVAEQMESRAMPPRNDEQPTEAERKLVVEWLTKNLQLKPSDTDRVSQYVVAAFQDRKGNLWFGTMHDGAVRYDGKTIKCFTKKDGLPTSVVTCFAEDKQGNLWVGTHAGVCKFDGEKFARIGSANGLPDAGRSSALNTASVRADRDGNIWVGMGQKIFHSEGESFTEFKMPIDVKKVSSFAIVPGRASFRLQDKAGNLWFGTEGAGAYKFDGKAFTQFTKEDGLCSNNVNSIVEDRQGNIWFACMQSYQPKMTGDGGVCRFDGKSFTTFSDVKGLSQNDIYTIYQARSGDLWIGATGVGAYRYDGTTFTLFDETDKPHWTRNFGVQAILEDRNGTLWFGFSGGLFRFDGKSFFNVTKDGPWKDLVSAMAAAAAGKLAATEQLHPRARAAFAAIANKDLEEATAILQKLKSAAPNEPAIQEKNINQLGYHFLFSRQFEIAIEIFKINTHLYPNVSNTFDSLGEGYWRKGDEKRAVENYKRALKLNPQNKTAADAIRSIEARQKYENILVAPKDWLEEVIIVPPSFAPSMSLTGMEHLRLPPEFRDPDSDWFISYLFVIELIEPSELNEEMIGEQLLSYFCGLASGSSDKDGKEIETDKFTIEPQKMAAAEGEYIYVLKWQEPFAGGTSLAQNIRVKLIKGKNQHGIVFICGSPQPFESGVWAELLKIRTKFEAASAIQNK
jgi:sugar lactone lactonase YvrE/mono/diheme cytochrome c family protein